MSDVMLNVSEIYGEAWTVFKREWKLVLGMTFVQIVVPNIASAYGDNESLLLSLISTVLSLYLSMITGFVMINLTRGSKVSLDQITGLSNRIWPYFKAYIRYGLYVLGGMILLIIPGIYFGLKYLFAPTLTLEETTSSGEAMKMSAKMTEGVKMQLFVFILVAMVLQVVGVLALFVGVFVTSGVISLSSAIVYHRLLARIKADPAGMPVPPVPGPGMSADQATSPYTGK